MAVKVYDRDGKEWTYERGASTQFDDLFLVIFDKSDNQIGAFNGPSWTHFSIPQDATTINVASVDEAFAATMAIQSQKPQYAPDPSDKLAVDAWQKAAKYIQR